jgi:hypothetical protein
MKKKLIIMTLATLFLGCNKNYVALSEGNQLNEYESFKNKAGIKDDNTGIQKYFEQKSKESGLKILNYTFGPNNKQELPLDHIDNSVSNIGAKAASGKKANYSEAALRSYYAFYGNTVLNGIPASIGSYDANVKWKVLENKAGLWNVFSEETITLKTWGRNEQTYIHAIAHLGSYLRGTGYIPLPVSWSEQLVDIYPSQDKLTYDTRHCIVRIVGTISMGWSWTESNYCLITAREW